MTLLIIADDFTGALDTGVKFAAWGASVRVVTDCRYEFGGRQEEAQVLVMDAETRHLRGHEAYQRVYGIVRRAVRAGVRYIYKKTDSALRGNIGSELSAVLDAGESRILHFFPAFPGMGRTTKMGIHYIDGVLVQESVFGRDPFEPVTCSDIPELIARQSDVFVKAVTDGRVVTCADRPLIAVYDAQKDRDLEIMARRLYDSGQMRLMAGCAGMAGMLPALLGLKGSVPELPGFRRGFFVACGSMNPITRRQVAYARRIGFRCIHLTPRQKLEPGYFETEEGRAKLREMVLLCRDNPLCILDTNDEPGGEDSMEYAREHGISLEAVRVRIAAALGYLVGKLIEEGMESTILITGGDSLLGFMNENRIYEMMPVCEIAPGTVLSEFEMNKKRLTIISKSGGFGEESLLADLAERFREEEEACVNL